MTNEKLNDEPKDSTQKFATEWLEPNCQGPEHAELTEWAQKFNKQHLAGTAKPDGDVAKLIYDHVLMEHKVCDEAHRSLTTKAHELLKLLAAFIGAYVLLVRVTPKKDDTVVAAWQDDWIAITAIVALALFALAMLIVVLCIRGISYVVPTGSKTMIDWYDEETTAAHLRLRTAVFLNRGLASNRHVNDWMSGKLSLAWALAIAGLTVLAIGIALRLLP